MSPVAILVCIVIALSTVRQTCPRVGGHPLVILGFNLLFVVLIMQPQALAWLAAFLVINYILALGARHCPAVPLAAFVSPAVVCFVVFKRYEILPLQPLYSHIPDILGLSFIVFRTLMIIVESRDATEVPGIVSYLNFCLNMVTFLSGPVQRYRAFRDDVERGSAFRLDEKDGSFALTRLMNGVLKLVYLAPLIQELQDYFMTVQQNVTTVVIRNEMTVTLHNPLEWLGGLAPACAFGLAALCYLVFLYFNFSGYTDMMIGLGRLLGFHLPENFDSPFRATSFLDFWKRWHISLSVWFRDYCFMPAWSATRGPVMKGAAKLGINDPAIATLPAYFISFGLLGLWHGRTWPFMLCGLMFAVGSSANHLYRARISRIRNKEAVDHLNRNPLYRSFAAALTLFYISIAVTGLWLPDATFSTVWRSFSVQQAAESFALIVVCLSGALYLGRKPWQAERVQALLIRPVHDFLFKETSALIAAKVFLVVIWLFVFSAHITDFVYQRF